MHKSLAVSISSIVLSICTIAITHAEVPISDIAYGDYTYTSKTVENGHTKAKPSGNLTFSRLSENDFRIYIQDRYSEITATFLGDKSFKLRIFNKSRKSVTLRTGSWRYTNSFLIFTKSRQSDSATIFKDNFAIPTQSPFRVGTIFTIYLKKNVHQRIYARKIQ